MTVSDLDIPRLRAALLAWYDRHARSLPWRERPSLYGTWISEIMLQQTTVATVEPRWTEFMARFPDVETLAASSEADVLDAWSGLGYYRRARQLHAAARHVVSELAGVLPRDERGWLELPGIGAYTAGAVASIGLGAVVPAVDTNVVRVLSRLVCSTPHEADSLRPAALRGLASALVDPERPGDWNQALMDLGASLCSPTAPRCSSCPFGEACRAREGGVPESIPTTKPKLVKTEGVWTLLYAELPGGFLVQRTRSPNLEASPDSAVRHDYKALYRGYIGLPFGPWVTSEGGEAESWNRWWTELGGTWRRPPEVVGSFRHAITKYRLKAIVVHGVADSIPSNLVQEGVEVLPVHESSIRLLNTPSLKAIGLGGLEI